MATVDPRLRYLTRRDPLTSFSAERLGLESIEAETPTVEVLVRLRREHDGEGVSLDALRQAGLEVTTVVPGPSTIVVGRISLDDLSALSQLAEVRKVESSRPMMTELDVCVPEVNAHIPHSANPAVRGAGTIIGVIDTGIDFRHPDFLDDQGNSRILLLWAQGAPSVPGSAVPYGREFTRAEINAALNGITPAADMPPVDTNGHGTHVCGIAAGCGRASLTHLGLAPDADIIVVAMGDDDALTLGKSTGALAAFEYVVSRAADTPVAINFSQGMNGGGHCGETLLERGIDNLARRPNVAIVKSAGNEQLMRIHAGGTLAQGDTRKLLLMVNSNDRADDVIEIWYDDADEIEVAVRPPGGQPTPFVARAPGQTQGSDQDFDTPTGNTISISVDPNQDGTGDTVVTIILTHGSAPMIQPGTWTLLLRAGPVRNGRFDAWVERAPRPGGEQTRFDDSSHDPTRTISIPGTARNIITVGAYVTRASQPPDAPAGMICTFSSRGPTRYGRLKPDLVTPGEVIESARGGTQTTVGMRGTSMAAPVVTGAAALIMSQRPGLTCAQLKQLLQRSARRTGPAASAPDNIFGHGKLDVAAALGLAAQVTFPSIFDVSVSGPTICWRTDIETTGAVRFLDDGIRLMLGKDTLSEADLTPGHNHCVTLAGQPPGRYFCEVLAFSLDNFSTEDDNGGLFFEVFVP
jgi:subtilisin family serine protease